MAEFYGIDLGTTYSCIARINSDDIVEVIQVKGAYFIPSAVAFDDNNQMMVGQAAKNNKTYNYENTVILIKREMSNLDYKRTINGKTYDPVDISSFILKELVDEANKKLANEEGLPPIYDVVITVPAYFGTIECERTKEAGERAGLNVLNLISEPTAAALSYGRKQKSNKTLLVYDLGGGTFDVSILKFQNYIADTIACDGDHHLGGADWDKAIVDFAMDKINMSFDSLSPEEQGMLMDAAEIAKITLSNSESTILTFSCKGLHNIKITRSEFESITARLLNDTMSLVDRALDRANKTISEIDEVILVGGSCYMPMVKEAVDKKFGKPAKLVDPNLAVAKGAALYATQIDKGYADGGITLGKDKGSRGYGMYTWSPKFNKFVIQTLINRNDDKVIRKEYDDFSTLNDGQTRINFRFYEYESDENILEVNEDWELKGKENYIDWGHPVPKGTPLKIIASRDSNGIVKIFAECQGATGEFVIVC